MEKWYIYSKRADFNAIGQKYGISPVTARILRNRDVVGDEAVSRYLKGTLDDLYSPWLLKDMDRAVAILMDKIEAGKSIRVVGDYDIDGVCSTYILTNGLRNCGANVDCEIPDRLKDGYGINIHILEDALKDGVDTVITCDNGISALDQIAYAKENNMTVIVTDHHDVPYEEREDGTKEYHLVKADAVVNPKQEDCSYPFEGICGAVVAFKVIQALYEKMKVPHSVIDDFLEFAAIATVGDVMQLQDENRILVKYGLERIRKTANLGLRCLIEESNLKPDAISAYHIGFVLGPCLNAGGRLQTAKLALSMLMSKDMEEARRLAVELKELNDVRKTMTLKGLEEAVQIIEGGEEQTEDEAPQNACSKDKVLVVFLPDCHESLAGIIAGRLRERYNKPSIVLTRAEEGVKGSGRSIEGYHMFQALTAVKDLLLKFGGHPMAAGLSLKEENIGEFRRSLNENARLTEDDFVKRIWIDAPMPFEYISEELIEELSVLEPFGQGNQKPLFAQKDLTIRNARVMGKNRNVVKLSMVTPQGYAMDGIVFGDGDAFEQERCGRRKMNITYYPSVNEYNGNRSLQVVVQNYSFV